ncbi:ribonuclease Oy isoform X1 [Electrophorus electricus]|uniref:Uncharacterized protein n=1 Tax=Electrophorus electricus TaxID=8005 RepID=A0A4W4HS62_ELEEL|nr:ribonuclease Oy isoform X1 [Electrophorus electricus]XP_026853603.2 ribonuclease Oy isoform X1 [Electrophorus electricus]XP_026853604.2 ribonuclease Oy isoform X1 [Electrophorus electricus]
MVWCKMSIILICSTVLLIGWVLTLDQALWTTSETRHSCNWTCMILTLQWPGSFCLSLNTKNICKIPQNIQNWTIHGLWPLHAHSCCSCWRIYHSHLQELEPELSQLWPSLLKSRSAFTFWKDEWYKHGTCAACMENLGSPQYYFRTSLKLRMLFDIDSALTNADIIPSCNTSYKFEDLHSALAPLLGDSSVLQCVKDEKEREVWVQLKIYISKNITLGCHKQEKKQALLIAKATNTSSGHPCPPNTTIFYFPIDYVHPEQPCN